MGDFDMPDEVEFTFTHAHMSIMDRVRHWRNRIYLWGHWRGWW